MNELKINIPVEKYIQLIKELEEDSWDVADKVHLTFLNHMTSKSSKLYFNEKYKVGR